MKIDVKYDGGLGRAAMNIGGNMTNVISSAAEAICEDAKGICPVDTGTLKNSITYESFGNSAEIFANTDYAAYVEFGTSKMAPKPYLVPSLIGGSEKIVQSILNLVAGQE